MRPAPCRLLALVLSAAVLAGAARAGEALRVGTSGDYPPFSESRDRRSYEGFDIAVARAYAADRGLDLQWVRFAWPRLLADLEAGRFDVAMSGVTVRPERATAGRFSVAVVETGAVLLVREPDRWRDLAALDSPAARIAVNAGGHLERVARENLPRATLLAIADNRAVLRALTSQAVDAVLSEQLEAALWQREIEGAALYGPLTRDRKAYLLPRDAGARAADLDAWLLEREADGTLGELRREHLGEAAAAPVATPLGALLAAVDERLALMPLVGAAKREQGLPLEVPEREARVLDAAVAGVTEEARRRGVDPPAESLVREFFRAQIEAAKAVQWAAVQDPGFEPPPPLPDVEEELRPALLRIGDKIARLLLRLPPDLEPAAVRESATRALRGPYLEPGQTRAIADAIVGLAGARGQPSREGVSSE